MSGKVKFVSVVRSTGSSVIAGGRITSSKLVPLVGKKVSVVVSESKEVKK